MSVTDVALGHYRQQAKLAKRVADSIRDLWRRVNPTALDLSWAVISTEALAVLIAGQSSAAAAADPYVTDVLLEQGIAGAIEGRIIPAAFAGIASDGRALDALLGEATIVTKSAIGRGATTARALAAGEVWLDMMARTQIADAGRSAVGTAITARPAVGGYVRMLNPPSCSRCAIRAGRWYRWNHGFHRHPRCDCRHIPTSEDRAGELRTDPKRYFQSLSGAEQDRLFTKAGAEAIRDGADIGQVVNSRRGMTVAGTTTESTTRAGVAKPGRLMPEEIYRRAGSDRDEAIRLLRQHGYLT